jgi:hypothetical protein
MTARVTVMGVTPGHPPMLSCYSRVRVMGGREKIQPQMLLIGDAELYGRLQREVSVGDEVEISVLTDWAAKGAPTYVTAFSPVVTSASATESPSAAG